MEGMACQGYMTDQLRAHHVAIDSVTVFTL